MGTSASKLKKKQKPKQATVKKPKYSMEELENLPSLEMLEAPYSSEAFEYLLMDMIRATSKADAKAILESTRSSAPCKSSLSTETVSAIYPKSKTSSSNMCGQSLEESPADTTVQECDGGDERMKEALHEEHDETLETQKIEVEESRQEVVVNITPENEICSEKLECIPLDITTVISTGKNYNSEDFENANNSFVEVEDEKETNEMSSSDNLLLEVSDEIVSFSKPETDIFFVYKGWEIHIDSEGAICLQEKGEVNENKTFIDVEEIDINNNQAKQEELNQVPISISSSESDLEIYKPVTTKNCNIDVIFDHREMASSRLPIAAESTSDFGMQSDVFRQYNERIRARNRRRDRPSEENMLMHRPEKKSRWRRFTSWVRRCFRRSPLMSNLGENSSWRSFGVRSSNFFVGFPARVYPYNPPSVESSGSGILLSSMDLLEKSPPPSQEFYHPILDREKFRKHVLGKKYDQ